MTSGLDKENATTEIGAAPPFSNNSKPSTKDKKSRSKSLGPGGLDALQNSNGNRRQVATNVTERAHMQNNSDLNIYSLRPPFR
jgi:hypothetical protein